MLKCVNTGSLPDYDSIDQLLDGVIALGFGGVELEVESFDNSFTFMQTDWSVEDLVIEARRRSLAICSVTSSRFDLFDLASPKKDDRVRVIAEIEVLLRSAEQLAREQTDPKIVVIGAHQRHSLGAVRLDSYEQAFNHVFEALEQLARVAETIGQSLAVENPGQGLILSPLELRELIDEVNSPYLGVCFNPYYAQYLGEPLDWLRILDRRIVGVCLPLKMAQNGAKKVIFSPEQVINWLEQAGFDGPIIYKEMMIQGKDKV